MATGTAEDEEAGTPAAPPDTARQPGAPVTHPARAAAGDVPEPTEADVLRWAFRCRRRWILAAVAFTAVHQMCEAAVPVMIGAVVDHAVRPGSTGGLLLWLALLAALFTVLSAAMRLGGRCNRNGSQGAAHELRLLAVSRILDPRGFTHSTRDPGALLSTATADTLRIGLGNRAWVLGGGAVASLAFGAVVLLLTSVPLGLLVLIGLVPLLWATRLLSGPLSARSGTEQKHAARATGTAADLIRGIRIVKGLGAEDAAESRYRTASRTMLEATVRAARWNAGHQAVTLLLNGVFLAVVAWSGARLTVEGSISVGEFVASVGLAQFLVGPSTRFGAAMELRARARGSARRLAALLAEPHAVSEPAPGAADGSPPVRGDGRAREVSGDDGGSGDGGEGRGDRGGELLVEGLTHGPLRAFGLRAAAGRTLGVAAADPAEAAALLDVLALRAPPGAGRLELDGRRLESLPLDEARGTLLVADHDADLFDATVEENVAVAAAAPALVAAAIDAADVAQVLSVLPDGRNGTVGERGAALSGGQRQRVALARALAADPPVLVLHEPTTAVDAVTEAKIARGLRELREDRTTVLVTTSPILLQSCEEVHFLEGGTVRASGTHRRLSAERPDYRAVVTA